MDSPNLARKTENLAAVNRKYKVLLVVRWPVGGIRTFLRYVYRNFDPELYQFTILAPDLPEMKILLEDLKQLDLTYVSAAHKSTSFSFLKHSTRLLFNNKFDLIHSQGFTSGLCSLIPGLLTRTPHILTVHDILNEFQFKGPRGFMMKIYLLLGLPMFSLIHSVSHDAQNNLMSYIRTLKIFKKKLIAIPNGIEVERFLTDERRDFRKELDLPDNAFLIGFLGRFMSPKGFVYLVDALETLVQEKISDRRPMVLAFGTGGFVREEMENIKNKGLEEYFKFLPFESNIAPSLRGLDVLAMPSLWEACGLAAMEAMVAGVPVIGTDCIGLREVLRGTPSGVVPAKNSDALVWALRKEMSGSSVEQALAFRGEAVARFDALQQAKALEKIAQGLINGSL